MGTVSAHLCLWPWSTVPLRAHSCDFHGAVLGYLRWFPSCMTWNQVPRVRSISYLRFSVWSLANGWSRSSEAQQRCPVSGETQHTTYTAEPPDRIRPRSGFYLKSHPSLSHPSYPLHSFPSSWPFIIHLFCTHSLITGFGFQGMWPKPGPLRWLWAWPTEMIAWSCKTESYQTGSLQLLLVGNPRWTDWSTESQHRYCRLCLRVSLSLSPLLLFWRRSSDRFLSVASKKILTQLKLELPNADDRLMRTQNKTQTHTQEALWFGYKVPLKT